MSPMLWVRYYLGYMCSPLAGNSPRFYQSLENGWRIVVAAQTTRLGRLISMTAKQRWWHSPANRLSPIRDTPRSTRHAHHLPPSLYSVPTFEGSRHGSCRLRPGPSGSPNRGTLKYSRTFNPIHPSTHPQNQKKKRDTNQAVGFVRNETANPPKSQPAPLCIL